jgi:hypothetical protein
LLRADSGFFDDRQLNFLEQCRLLSTAVARLTKWVKRAAQDVTQWSTLDDYFAEGEFRLKLLAWDVERRFVVVRARLREERESVGRRLIELPGYTFRVFVTGWMEPLAEVRRSYNRRADMENRIAELKHDLGADGFHLKQFHATLGWLESKNPLARQHPGLANPNFAEVGFRVRDLFGFQAQSITALLAMI